MDPVVRISESKPPETPTVEEATAIIYPHKPFGHGYRVTQSTYQRYANTVIASGILAIVAIKGVEHFHRPMVIPTLVVAVATFLGAQRWALRDAMRLPKLSRAEWRTLNTHEQGSPVRPILALVLSVLTTGFLIWLGWWFWSRNHQWEALPVIGVAIVLLVMGFFMNLRQLRDRRKLVESWRQNPPLPSEIAYGETLTSERDVAYPQTRVYFRVDMPEDSTEL